MLNDYLSAGHEYTTSFGLYAAYPRQNGGVTLKLIYYLH